jgi:hypothetical protein
LIVDAGAVIDAVETADRLAVAAEPIALGPTGKKMVRRQVKAEIKSLLTDDAMVAAYRQHGSYRKAAEELTKQIGQPISKDKIARAVDRQGGHRDVSAGEDSPSVARTVAPHRHKRAHQFLQRR